MYRSYKFRIYPTRQQSDLINRTFGCCRFVFNYFLADRISQYDATGRTPTQFEQSRSLTQLKRRFEWLQEVDSEATRYSLRILDLAYRNFFRRIKSGKPCRHPKFKRKKRGRQAYRTYGAIKLHSGTIQLPKLGLVKCKISRSVRGKILHATVMQNSSGRYFVSIECQDTEMHPGNMTGKAVGIDLGLHSYVTTSDGVKYSNPMYLQNQQKRLTKLQRRLSRKSSGSARWEKARIQLARFHEKITNQRHDTLHKLSTDIVRHYDFIVLEDLAVSTMYTHSALSLAIYDAAWREFRRQVEYKSTWQGKQVVVVDQFFPSSQLCSNCGYRNTKLRDASIRNWTCPMCNAVHDRDINAAKNLVKEGLRLRV